MVDTGVSERGCPSIICWDVFKWFLGYIIYDAIRCDIRYLNIYMLPVFFLQKRFRASIIYI